MSPLFDPIPLWRAVDHAASEQTDAAASHRRDAAKSGDALPELITVADAASVFGRSERTMSRWIARGWLPALPVGRSLFIRSDDVRKLIIEGMLNKAARTRAIFSEKEGSPEMPSAATPEVYVALEEVFVVSTPDASSLGTGV